MICRQEWQPSQFINFSFKGKLYQTKSGSSIRCFWYVQPTDTLSMSAGVTGYFLNRGRRLQLFSYLVHLFFYSVVYENVESEVFFRWYKCRRRTEGSQSSGSAKHPMLKLINRKTRYRRLNLIFMCPKMFHTFMRISKMDSMFSYFLGVCGRWISLRSYWLQRGTEACSYGSGISYCDGCFGSSGNCLCSVLDLWFFGRYC